MKGYRAGMHSALGQVELSLQGAQDFVVDLVFVARPEERITLWLQCNENGFVSLSEVPPCRGRFPLQRNGIQTVLILIDQLLKDGGGVAILRPCAMQMDDRLGSQDTSSFLLFPS